MGLNGGSRGASVGSELVQAVGEFLAGRSGSDRVEVHAMQRLGGGGAVQENYLVDVDLAGGASPGRQPLVLRTDAKATIGASLSRAEEFAVLRAAHAAGVRVPEPLWLCEDESVIGRPFYVMRRAPGEAAGHRLVRDERVAAHGDELVERLGEELAQVHGIRPPHAGLEFLPDPGNSPALGRVNACRDHLDRVSEPQPTIEWGLRWLERYRPQESEVVLCHGDFRVGNLLVHAGDLAGVLDWEFASWSDPHEDIGWFCARCWRFGRIEREAGGLGSREAFYRGYERVSGRKIDRSLIPYWEVMASCRWAVIALQQAERHASGGEESLELALTGRLVPEMELDILMQLDVIAGRIRA